MGSHTNVTTMIIRLSLTLVAHVWKVYMVWKDQLDEIARARGMQREPGPIHLSVELPVEAD